MNARPDAWLCFTDSVQLRWLRLLRPGFRHCFVVLRDGDVWVVVNAAAHGLEIRVEPCADPGEFYRKAGITILPVRRRPFTSKPFAWAPMSCVETVKRSLGVRNVWIATPWQLFRYTSDERNKLLDVDLMRAYESDQDNL